jgi:hypothetical protein
MKWWIGGLGVADTHAVVYAQLVIKGKEYGVHVFFVQLRDEDHRPLPGIEVGDCGHKLGDNSVDTGYMRLKVACASLVVPCVSCAVALTLCVVASTRSSVDVLSCIPLCVFSSFPLLHHHHLHHHHHHHHHHHLFPRPSVSCGSM